MKLLLFLLSFTLLAQPVDDDVLTVEDAAAYRTLKTEQWRRSSAWWERQARTLAAEKSLGEINTSVDTKKSELRMKYKKPSCDLADDLKWECPKTVQQ